MPFSGRLRIPQHLTAFLILTAELHGHLYLSRELRHLTLLVAPHDILHGDMQRRLLAFDVHSFDLDELAQALLQRALDHKLGGGGELSTVGREDELLQTGAKSRPVDAFARRGEEQLLDHLADMLILAGWRRPPATVDIKRMVDVHYIPFTRTWVTTTLSGVPFGMQTAWLSCSSTGWPPANTRGRR